MSVNLTEKQKELIESFGVIQKRMGLTPAFARVNALLTICDETELTFEQIQDGLNLSKSATSNALQGLLAIDRIGYKTKPGERTDCRRQCFHEKIDERRCGLFVKLAFLFRNKLPGSLPGSTFKD